MKNKNNKGVFIYIFFQGVLKLQADHRNPEGRFLDGLQHPAEFTSQEFSTGGAQSLVGSAKGSPLDGHSRDFSGDVLQLLQHHLCSRTFVLSRISGPSGSLS